MSEIPSTFLSKKTFQSLPQLAFWTWLIVFVIDAVVLQRYKNYFVRVALVWSIGLSISFVLEILRYKSLSTADKAEYGYKFFFILNAFLIFFYAASFTGLTTQIGAWGVLQSTLNKQSIKQSNKQSKKIGEAAILLEVQEWAIPIFAKQTSYFPDIAAIAENNELKAQNIKLRDSLAMQGKDYELPQIKYLTDANSALTKKNVLLNDSLKDCEKKLLNPKPNSNKDETLIAENQSIKNDNNSLKKNNTLMSGQIKILQQRINTFNSKQSEWAKLTGGKLDSDIKGMITKGTKDPNFFSFLFYTPIDATLPSN